ncbi:MAG TPA: hypothetical protein VFD70_27985 [Anaerolineae bacterium]|nr:hypothetical protein [Anaerolineae bacterium]
MNVKKTITIFLFGALALFVVACGGSNDATPTRTRVAQAEPTQTPWIVYVPVTVTPGPATATLEPTVTSNAPPPTAVPPTRPPATPRPVQPTNPPEQPTTPAEPPTAPPPPTTPVPSCGSTYQVTKLTFPANGDVRDVKNTPGKEGKTIQFKWEPIAAYEMDPKIGYRVNVSTKFNSVALYISHNDYLQKKVAILGAQPAWGLTNGDDMTATWNVEVIMASGEFNDAGDDREPPLGTITVCGPPSPSFTIPLHVVGT